MKLSGEMKKSFDEIFFTQTEFRNIPEKAKEVMIGFKSVDFHTAYISYGALQVIGYEQFQKKRQSSSTLCKSVRTNLYPFSRSAKSRSAGKRSHIEMALERVRSRTMAMRSSSELKEVITVVMEQFKQLGFFLTWQTLI